MDIDEATAILKEGTADWHTQTAAAAYTISFYNEHRDRLKPAPWAKSYTTDAHGVMPMRSTTKDAAVIRERAAWAALARDAAPEVDWSRAMRDAETNPSGMGRYEFPTAEQSEMGNREGGVFPVGAEVLQVLPGEPAGYFIFIDGQGRACLCRHATANNLQSMGVTKDAFVNFARAKEKQDQRAMRGIASTVKNFWAKQNAA